MAEESGEVKLTLKWVNNEFFELKAKIDEAEPLIIIRVEENACIKKLWPHVANVCKEFFNDQIFKIGTVMESD